MRIQRYRIPAVFLRTRGKSYGHITANYWEQRYLRKRIAAGDTGITEIPPDKRWQRNDGALFVITAKRTNNNPT